MEIKFNKKFVKQYDKVDAKIKSLFENRLNLFLENPLHPLLNNHALQGHLYGYRSINITGDWRALYTEYTVETTQLIIFEIIGTHSQLYK